MMTYPWLETYGRILEIANTSTAKEEFIEKIEEEAPEYSYEYYDEIKDIAKKIYDRDGQITETWVLQCFWIFLAFLTWPSSERKEIMGFLRFFRFE